MIDWTELKEIGWTLVEGVASQEDLLELGRAVGRPVPSPNGELVKEIRRTSADEAPPGSQSSIYGTGPFPLHTDTAFWPIPARYVILRGHGDTRRPTTVTGFSDLLRDYDDDFFALADESVWIVKTSTTCCYCSLRFRNDDSIGWRYDADLMLPANDAAKSVNSVLRRLVFTGSTDEIKWSGTAAAVISNWCALHGRGPEPPDEGVRIIERLYVR